MTMASLNQQYSCLVVDDEPPARDVLRRYIQQMPVLTLAGECSNALQAMSVLQQQHIDLLFLDIHMPQVSGIDLIKTLSASPKIILTTAYEQYAIQAFELEVSDYLLKPIAFDRFLKAVMRSLPAAPRPAVQAIAPANEQPPFLYFRADRKMVKVLLEEICYVESFKDYVKIFTVREQVITKHSMVALESMLPAARFLRIHRSYIVAINKITAFTNEQVEITGIVLPIGRLYRLQVMQALHPLQP